NNPTGTYFTRDELDRFLERLPKRVLVILDEAYFEFAQEFEDYPDSMHYRHDQVITLRTFSKAYGLAGVRIGYGIAHEYLIGNLMKIKLPFEPSDLAQAAGLGALDDEDFLEQTLAMNREGREYFYKEFARLGLRFYRTASNFILLVFRDEAEVVALNDFLLRRGVIIRPLKAFGLPHCMRVTIGTMAENRRCVAALSEWCVRG
ncbi:aminotransferase class I/II-fold pyridoxal phosphate-dependent enzyme, partial [bacterium]|nr:aminotransferase class I/II-fold pyridoxal phosphate-dependent enzyme [bacterium]